MKQCEGADPKEICWRHSPGGIRDPRCLRCAHWEICHTQKRHVDATEPIAEEHSAHVCDQCEEPFHCRRPAPCEGRRCRFCRGISRARDVGWADGGILDRRPWSDAPFAELMPRDMVLPRELADKLKRETDDVWERYRNSPPVKITSAAINVKHKTLPSCSRPISDLNAIDSALERMWNDYKILPAIYAVECERCGRKDLVSVVLAREALCADCRESDRMAKRVSFDLYLKQANGWSAEKIADVVMRNLYEESPPPARDPLRARTTNWHVEGAPVAEWHWLNGFSEMINQASDAWIKSLVTDSLDEEMARFVHLKNIGPERSDGFLVSGEIPLGKDGNPAWYPIEFGNKGVSITGDEVIVEGLSDAEFCSLLDSPEGALIYGKSIVWADRGFKSLPIKYGTRDATTLDKCCPGGVEHIGPGGVRARCFYPHPL